MNQRNIKIHGLHFLQTKPVNKCSIKTINQVLLGLLTVIVFSFMVTMQLRPHLFNSDDKPGPENKPGIDSTGSLRGCIVSGCDMFCANLKGKTLESVILQFMMNLSNVCNIGDGVRLMLSNPSFTNGTLPSFFLRSSNFKLASLHIYGGHFTYIQPLAFAADVFTKLQTLTLEALNLTELEHHSLENLPALMTLNVRSCNLTHVTQQVLSAISGTLRTLQIERSKSWQPSSVIGTVNFPFLEDLDLRFNAFGNILNKNSFVGVTQCKKLFLASSKITAIENGAFDHFEKIVYINLNNNFITLLTYGIFNKIISLPHKAEITIDLYQNPWVCTCELDFLKLMQADGFIKVDPNCADPPQLRDCSFSSIKSFCFSNMSYVTAGITLESPTTDVDIQPVFTVGVSPTKVFEPTFKLTCDLESNEMYVFKSEINSIYGLFHQQSFLFSPVTTFSLKNTKYGVAIHIDSSLESTFNLIWFQVYPNDVNSSLRANNVSCLYSVTSGNIIKLLKANVTYVFCFVVDSAMHLSPQDCLSHKISDYSEFTSASNWYFFDKKHLSISIFVMSMFLCLIFGATTVFITVRKNPTLLKGSKRMVIVKNRIADASVLQPATTAENHYLGENAECRQHIEMNGSFSERGYQSDSSSPSYISALQPTEEDLAKWRSARVDKKCVTPESRVSVCII